MFHGLNGQIMRRLNKLSVITCLTLVLCLLGFDPHLAGVSPPSIPILTRNFEKVYRFYAMRFKYPQIQGATRFNARVREIVREATGKFRQAMGDVKEKPQYDGYIDGKYKATVLKSGIVSVLLEWSEYFPGAAHPGGTSVSINYDSRTGRVLQLADLFRPGVDYVSRLSELAIKDLNGSVFEESVVIEHGAGPVEANFQVFSLTDTSLILHFQTYQVAAGAAGPQDVEISLTDLEPLLSKTIVERFVIPTDTINPGR